MRPLLSHAQDEPAPEAPEARPTLRAAPLGAEILDLDGRLEEAAWATPDSIANLVTIEPEEGGVPAGRTVIKVLAGTNEVIVGVRCFDPKPSGIVAFSKARDSELDEEDHVLLVFDTFGDERSGYVFAVNPNGSRFDGLVTAQGTDVNGSWDTLWEAATSTDAEGWTAEIRIPIQSLSFRKHLTNWGFNIERRVQRLQESSRWSGAKRDYEIFQTSRAGLLTDLPAFDLGMGLSVRPGVVANAQRPFPGTTREVKDDLSLDLTQKLGSNLAATVTVNTDFGETEVDARQTNLSRFDLFFPEKRSFFLEGADIFEFGYDLDPEDPSVVPFFSRRIGLYTPEGEDEGTQVPLLAGGKVQGRAGNTNLGALFVGTDRVRSFGVPRSNMGALRVRQNVLEESSVGVIGTFGDPLNRRDSWLGGADFTYRTSRFRGDKNLSAGVWGLRTDRRDLLGDKYAFGGKVAYPNDEIEASLAYLRIGDGFDPSLGFVQRRGHVVDALTEYNLRPESSPVRRFAFGLTGRQVLKRSGGWDSYSYALKSADLQFESGERIQVTTHIQGERPTEEFDVFDSPAKTVEIPAGLYRWTRHTVTGTLAPKRPIRGEASASFGGFYDGELETLEAALVLEPVPFLTFQLSTERNHATLPDHRFTQYLYGARTELKTSPEFQISHFLQYDNESRSLGSAARLRWTFHPQGDVFVSYNHNMVRFVTDRSKRWNFESDQMLTKVQYAVRL